VRNSISASHVTRNKGFIREFDEETTQRILDHDIKARSPTGVLGDPSGASSEHSRAYLEDLTSTMV
jgi:creatinine amidohydrolase/Fe(II)-dependent formamide hydrolase-like protein